MILALWAWRVTHQALMTMLINVFDPIMKESRRVSCNAAIWILSRCSRSCRSRHQDLRIIKGHTSQESTSQHLCLACSMLHLNTPATFSSQSSCNKKISQPICHCELNHSYFQLDSMWPYGLAIHAKTWCVVWRTWQYDAISCWTITWLICFDC